MAHTVTDVKCVAKGKDYYATVDGIRLRYALNQTEPDVVMIYTRDACIGGFNLQRFGGELSPDGIRALYAN